MFQSIDDYITAQAPDLRQGLEILRLNIKEAVPEAVEVISYQMPAFKYYGILAYFAVFKDHYSLFITPKIKDEFAEKLAVYRQTKSAIHFKFNNPIPEDLVKEIVIRVAEANLLKYQSRKTRR